jgi:type IV pilus assembly protein PilV
MAVMTRARAALSPVRHGRRDDAFTLLEVVISLGILAFGLLGVAAMQLYSLRQGQVGKHTSQAATIAQDRLERLNRMSFGALNPAGSWQNVGTVTETIVAASGNRDEAVYTVEERISNVVVNFTKNIDVRVTWSDAEDPNKTVVISTRRYNY